MRPSKTTQWVENQILAAGLPVNGDTIYWMRDRIRNRNDARKTYVALLCRVRNYRLEAMRSDDASYRYMLLRWMKEVVRDAAKIRRGLYYYV